MVRLLLVGSLSAVLFVGCGRTVDVERVCDLNDEFAALNERTLPNIEDDPFPAPAMLVRTRVGAWFVEHCGKELQG